uniref:DUF4870 domain-containing protein n=1 Tax=Vannella robusta TaxID=1487602 RepID=A0A7S4I888_9EUKA|mmetsp:Transcript_21790/g.27772  ORF Transcript_21790/g.27772 Transcript_21790/m.27772 type:complete len:153 (+) Transcript_21790:76-534(+)
MGIDNTDSNVPTYAPLPGANQSPVSQEEEIPQVLPNSGIRVDMAEFFHLISMVCAAAAFLTFLFFLEIIPAVCFFLLKDHLKKQTQKHKVIYYFNLAITLGVGLYFLLWETLFAILTFGIGLIFLPFLIPYVIVFVGTYTTRPKPSEVVNIL